MHQSWLSKAVDEQGMDRDDQMEVVQYYYKVHVSE